MLGLTQDQEDALLSILAEADRYVRETAIADVDRDVLRRKFDEAYEVLSQPKPTLEVVQEEGTV